MMTLRERRLPDAKGSRSMRLLIDDPETKTNSQKTHGIWMLFVSVEVRDEVIQGLRRGVECGLFTSVGFDESPADSDGPRRWVWAMEEGHLTRRRLWANLKVFERMGFDSSWMYCDAGAERHKSARRLLSGKGPSGPVTEFDFRKGGDEPIIREVPFPAK